MSILASDRGKTWALAAIVTALAGLLYFVTAARDIVVGDTPELITAAVTLGVPHPPGYPLFTMLGHLFSLLPVGPIPFRVNLLAVTCDALTVGIVYFTGLRLSGNRLAAALAALVLAVSHLFWAWSLVAEVFPLNNLLASLLIYLLVRWHEQPERTGVLVGAFFLAGLGLTNHQTIVLLVPAFCFVLWRRRDFVRPRRKIVDLCAVAFLAGLLPYVYVPWASAHQPAYNWGDVSSLKDFLSLVTRQSYGGHRLVGTVGYTGGSVIDRIVALGVSFGPLMGSVVLLGLIQAFRRQRWYFYFSVVAFVFAGPFFVAISNLNLATAPAALYVLERFFILSHVVLAPLLALGVLMIAEFIGARAPRLSIPPLRLVAGAVFIAVLATVAKNYRNIDQSHNHIARTFAEDVFNTVEPGTILLASGDAFILPLVYLRTVEGAGGNVTLVLLPLLSADWYLRQLRERYPDFAVPFTHYDGQLTNLKMLVEANKGRTIAVIGPVTGNDTSLGEGYWFYQYGLVNLILPRSSDRTIQEMVKDSERLLKRYRPPLPGQIKSETFERALLSLYAVPALRMGDFSEQLGLKAEARAWYQRALAVDPDLPQVREALARVE